ncbi:MAG: hypothetical protein HQM10_22585 [Candidatus Riflebacteria bacterium]|nr:hypothetical protein [Candidatus Riflebacteria bacterium]
MKQNNRFRGVTLTEIMIGLAIFGAIGASFLAFMGFSTKDLQFSSDHFSAVVYSQKIMEDIKEEVAVNPNAFEALGIGETSSSYQNLIDAQSVFFSHLQDAKEPWGKIDPMVDGQISSEMKALYKSAKDFQFKVTAKPLADSGNTAERNLMNCNLEFKWETKTGKGKVTTNCLYFTPITPKLTDLSLLVDEAAIDARIPADFLNQPGRSLLELAAEKGVSFESLRALGRMAIITEDFVTSDFIDKRKKEVANLKAALDSTPSDKIDIIYDYRIKIAQSWYSLAKACYQIVAYLQPLFSVIQADITANHIGPNKIGLIRFQQSAYFFRVMYDYFVGSIIQARYHYYSLLEDKIAAYKGGRIQLQIMEKVFDLYRIAAVIPTRPQGMSEFKSFLSRMDEFADGRNPFLSRMIKQELVYLDTPQLWMKKFPNLERISKQVTEDIPGILNFISNTAEQAIINRSQ